MKSIGEFDYIIVGGGAAGCVLANRLSRDPSNSVLLLEAGGKDDWYWIKVPVGYLYCVGNPRTDWCYKTTPQSEFNGRSISYPRGRVLGGSSSINASIYMRGQAADYNHWAELTGDAGWRWESVLPYFKRSEDHWSGANEFHGAGGELRVERPKVRSFLAEEFGEASVEAGLPRTEDFNSGDNFGVGIFEVNQKDRRRCSSSTAFLHPSLNRPNLTVMTGVLVDKLHFEGKRVKAVAFKKNGQPMTAQCRKEILLAAGAVGSPAILQRSGLGSGRFLRSLGIEPVRELSGVGENLQDHLRLRVIYRVSGILSFNELLRSWWRKALYYFQYLFFRQGMLTMSVSPIGLFARADESSPTPDVQIHVTPLALENSGVSLLKFPGCTISICQLRPKSRGHVRITSSDPVQAPEISPNFMSHAFDKEIVIKGLKLVRRIASMPRFMKYSPVEYQPGSKLSSDEQLLDGAREIGSTLYHPVGTCKMGRDDDPLAVVDTQLRVRGFENLRVIDASIMPTLVSGNTFAPTVMIAERGSDLVLGLAK